MELPKYPRVRIEGHGQCEMSTSVNTMATFRQESKTQEHREPQQRTCYHVNELPSEWSASSGHERDRHQESMTTGRDPGLPNDHANQKAARTRRSSADAEEPRAPWIHQGNIGELPHRLQAIELL